LYRTSVLEADCDISQAFDKEALANRRRRVALFLGTADLWLHSSMHLTKAGCVGMGYSRISRLKTATLGMLAIESGTEASDPRQCLECGKLIVHRRVTALYCSGKCREIHNAQKRRQARHDTKNPQPPTCAREADV
jgi:hypothetical protein